jgi:sporulation protein YlmC with PRC-barrel domain
MDVEIGSNLYRNTDGTVEVEGVPQVVFALPKPTGPLLVTFVVYDETGRVVGKVVDSTMAFNERRVHDLARTPTSLLVKNTETGKVVLQAELKEAGRVVWRQGELRTVRGHVLEVSPMEWRIEKHRMSEGNSDLQGKSMAIG